MVELGSSEIYWIPSLFIGIVAAITSWNVAGKKGVPGSAALLFLMLGCAEWCVCHAFEIRAGGIEGKIFWQKWQYLGVSCAVMTLFFFVAGYVGIDSIQRFPIWFLLILFPIAVQFLVWLPRFKGLMWTNPNIDPSGPYSRLILEPGVLHWVWMVYLGLVMLATLAILIQSMFHTPKIIRIQAGLMTGAVLLPTIGLAMAVFPMGLWTHLNPAPYTFALGSLIIVWGALRFRFHEIRPVAREMVFESMVDGVLVMDRRFRLMDFNNSALELMNLEEKGIIGKTFSVLFQKDPTLLERMADDEVRQAEMVMGDWPNNRYLELRLVPMKGKRRQLLAYALLIRDVSERKKVETELMQASLVDSMTGVMKKNHFLDLLKLEADRSARFGHKLTVLYVDIDHMTALNNSFNETAGDEVLKAVADAIRSSVRNIDLIGRLDGDEFGVVLPETGPKGGAKSADRIRNAVDELTVATNRGNLGATVSVGIATTGPEEVEPETILNTAKENAMTAGSKGGNQYEPEQDEPELENTRQSPTAPEK